ncbi:hypothetical protein L9F63_002283, partial [Diploptera punctata]
PPPPPPTTTTQARRLLWRHYYPEGGWGWVVVGCSVGVHVLNHGLQLGGGMPITFSCKYNLTTT